MNEQGNEDLSTGINSEEILQTVMQSAQLDRDGFRMSLWAGLYTGPAFAEVERRLGLNRDENNVLFLLALYGQLTAKNISEFLGRPKNSISRAIERLLKKGLIHTEVDPKDRRRILLTIEEPGRVLYEQSSRYWREREASLLSKLTATDRVALDAILAKMISAARDWAEPVAEDPDL